MHDGEIWGYAMLMTVLAIPVYAGTALISEVWAISDEDPHIDRVTSARITAPCPIAARGIAVYLTLATGRLIDGVTGSDGTFVYVATSPDELAGAVTARADDITAPLEVHVADETAPPHATVDLR
jgi:hypothetical protein